MAPADSPPITDLSDGALAELVAALGGKPFQARQLSHWVYKHGAVDFDECQNLPKSLRTRLRDRGPLLQSRIVKTVRSADGTSKFLIELRDAEAVEAVLIPEDSRNTLCVSAQVGCPVACVFCASGLDGVRRNLSTGEIVEQVLHARRCLDPGREITNVVFMGIGEPMLNLDNLLPALARIHDAEGLNMGARRITVSTAGYPEHIDRFARAPHAFNLAISLHSADDALRRRLVPTAKSNVQEIIDAGRRFAASTNRHVTFEVVLLAGINDRPRDASSLIRSLQRVPCTVNLIPWNPVEQIPDLRRPPRHRVEEFAQLLRAGGLNVTVRRQRGADRSAACGQLRILERRSDATVRNQD